MIKASVGFELKLHHNFCDDAHIRELDKMYRYIQCLFYIGFLYIREMERKSE